MENNYSSRLMYSKTCPTSFQRRGSSKQLGRHTDPSIYTLDRGKTTSKRSSEDTLERCSKRRRTSQSPKESFSWTVSGPDSTGSSSYQSLSGHTNTELRSSSEESWTSACTTIDSSKTEEQRSKKRKSEDTQGPRKRSRKTHSPSEEPSCQDTPQDPSSDQPSTSSSPDSFPRHSRAAFEAKYDEEEDNELGAGGFGLIYAGYRREDNLAVAIKHLSQFEIERTPAFVDGNLQDDVPLEVALLLKVKPEVGETSAVVALLDWYDLEHELILVLERPFPCMDLGNFITSGYNLSEEQAKHVTKQLVDAFIDIHSKGVFHRDIKLDNILIETRSVTPRIWIIDFGCGKFLSDRVYTDEQGTSLYTSPEFFLSGRYKAEPTTVWQLGVVLFAILHRAFPFTNSTEIAYNKPVICRRLPLACKDFLRRCLNKSPDARPTLEQLKDHQWLN